MNNDNELTMNEVEGSNGTKYQGSIKVDKDRKINEIDVTIKNLKDNNGVVYSLYKEKNVSVTDIFNTDVNKDGKVDIEDLAKVALKYNKSPEDDVEWNPDLDINKDNIIDIFDITLVSKEII